MEKIIGSRIISHDPLDLEIELPGGSTTIRVTADWYPDGDYGRDHLQNALDNFHKANSVRQWLNWSELRLISTNDAEYILLEKNVVAKLYDRSERWLSGQLAKTPCPIPCRNIKRTTIELLKSEYDRLLKRQLEKSK